MENLPQLPVFVRTAISKFLDWNNPSRTRLERHEALKAFLFSNSENSTVEYLLKIDGSRKRVDFVGDGFAIEIDHSMKPRSLEKLKVMVQKGYFSIWIILRPTASYPRKFGQIEKLATKSKIQVVILRSLAK